jgi:hypothetical protein
MRMPKIDLLPMRNACPCEEEAVIAAGVAHYASEAEGGRYIRLIITDTDGADRVRREHAEAHQPPKERDADE